jgi:hypothetical protein
MSTRSTLLTAATIIGAFVVGRMLASDEPAPAPLASKPRQAPPSAGISAAEIRHAVRAELQRERPTTVLTREAVVEEEPSSEVLEQRAKALMQARAVVNSAVSARKWTDADARALLGLMPLLGGEEHDEILTSLIGPVNAGHMKVETTGSLLDPS